jgi:purine nucleosidase
LWALIQNLNTVKNTGKMLISCDTGIDDALALAYALGRDEKELVGVIAGFGVADVAHTWRNTCHILKLLGATVPVVMGASVPLCRPGRDYDATASVFHGRDGLGDLLGPAEARSGDEDAGAACILEMTARWGRDLVLVTTGPLTDLARALRIDPLLHEKIGGVVCMAGALAAPGNVNPFAEANAKADVEAAKLVLESPLPLVLIGLDVTRKTLFRKSDLARWQGINTPAARFFSAAAGAYLDAYARRYPYLAGCALHDPLAVGAAFNPEWFTFVPMHLSAVTEGEASGRTCENLDRSGDGEYTGAGAFFVDAAAFETDFFARVETIIGFCKRPGE